MKVVKSQNKDWLQKKGYSKKILLDENDLDYKGGLVQEIRVKPGEVAKDHYHKQQTEIFYFLTKNGYWVINDEKLFFEIGDVLVIEPNDRHYVMNDTENDYIYLAFKFNYSEDDLYWS
jgi:mannose-6-phosphate isomerase-like protein (cupin superfamily)